MRAEASSSRLLAPSARANGTSASAASTTASTASKRGSGGSLAPPPLPTYGYGLRRPSGTASSVTSSTASSSTRRRASEEKSKAAASSTSSSPPKLALHELQASAQSTPLTSTPSFLKRGSGRTIATLGNPMVATPPTSQTSVRRASGSPARQPSTTPTRQRSRHSSIKAETEDPRRSPQFQAKTEPQTQLSGFTSPEAYPRQRKRSADMMELQAQLGAYKQDGFSNDANGDASMPALTNGNAQVKREDEEVDEPPVLTLDDEPKARGQPTTPPRRSSAEANFYGDGLPVSPPDSKRLKRLTRSPKTPLGISSYTPTDGDGLSATQRVRLSLSGYVTVASLTGQDPRQRRSLGGSDAAGLLAYSASTPVAATVPTPTPSAFPSETETKSTRPQQIPRSLSGSLDQSTSSQKRSKFAASRSQSGPAQVATALLPTKHSVDCLMGYIRELQVSEATLRLQVEKTRKQKHDELSRSMLRVNSLETTMSQIEMQRERERKELEEHQQMIQELTAEVMQLREYFARQEQHGHEQQQQQHHQSQHPLQQEQQAYEGAGTDARYGDPAVCDGDVYVLDPSQASDVNVDGTYDGQWTDNHSQSAEQFVEQQYSADQNHSGGETNEYQEPSAWNNGILESEPPAPYSQEAGLGTDYETKPVPATDQYAYAQTSEANFDYQVDQSTYAPEGQLAEGTTEWTDPNAGYYGGEYQQYQQEETTNTSAESEWRDQQQANYEQSYDHQSQYQSEYSEGYETQQYPQHGDIYSNPASYELPQRYASPALDTTPQPPLSPVASPEAVRNARATAAASTPMIDPPPPMFRIAPRLSDIISPLARSSAASVNSAVDHNVLKPVTTQALSNLPEEGGRKQQRGKNTAHAMTPPRPAGSAGPPVFSMGDISSTFEPVPRLPTPPPSSRGSTGYQTPEQPSRQVHGEDEAPIPEAPANIEDEQFVPATQFFKPFQKLKLASHKTSTPSSEPFPASTKLPFDKLLIEFFTAVDKQKLPMVEGYTKRYKGHEEKLFAELTKKYGADKVAELKNKFEHGESPPQQVEEPPATPVEFMTPPPPPSRTRGQVLSPQSFQVSATSALSPDMQAPLSPEAGGAGIFGAESPAHPFLMSAASFDGSPSGFHQAEHSSVSASPFSSPPKSASPSRKVSPNGRRRGPPLPFSFDEATAQSSEKMLPAIPPPPAVSVMAPPPLHPRVPGMAAPPTTPPRLAPSPPREPPPRSRSPVRNVGIVRQRVSPQNRRHQSESGAGVFPPPLGNHSSTPPIPLNGKTSPVQPVTLESLLNELYRKHQPDKLKNVPAVVKEYTGKERELVAQLKQTYGALSVKKLELNLETLVQQGRAASASTPAVSSPVAVRSSPPIAVPVKKRGWIRRLVGLLIKLVLIRFVVVLLAFGGLVTLNHFQCGKIIEESTTADASRDCSTLQEGVETFDYTRLTEYVQRVESLECFCEKWTAQEQALWQTPSLVSSIDLAKLTPFSRTIAEPAFFYFVDTYLPDLPWGECYESYGKPTVHATKEYYVVYVKPAIHTTKEYYEVYAKPAIQVGKEYAGIGYEHARIVWIDVKAHLAELPWDEYYQTYAQPTIIVAREYIAVGYEHAKVAYAEMSVVVADSWAQLVEMYNEEGAQVAVRHQYHVSDEKDGELASTSMDDALTKAAMASKSLAEPSETEAVEVPKTSEETEVEAVVPEFAEEVKTEPEVETTVEVAVEQTGLNVEYVHESTADVESALPTEELENDEVIAVEIVETPDEAEPLEAAPVDVTVQPVDKSVSEVPSEVDEVEVEADHTTDAAAVAEAIGAEEEVTADASSESVVDAGGEESYEVSEDALPAEIEAADEIPQPELELTDVTEAAVAEVGTESDEVAAADEVLESTAEHLLESFETDVELVHEAASDSVVIAEDPSNSNESEPTSDEAPVDADADVLPAAQEEEEPSPEELAVLEDLAGLDPLELLDMADLAAAEMYTAQ